MAEAPEEVTVVVDAEDRASPSLLGIGRNIVMLGTNLAMIARELGITNPALNAMINAIQLVGHVVRLAYQVQYLYAAALKIVNMLTEENVVATTAATGVKVAQIGANEALTASNYGLASSFAAVNAAMGPIGWAMLGLGLVGAAVAGYALGGGMGSAPPRIGSAGAGQGNPNINVYMGNVSMRTQQDIEETVSSLKTHINVQTRRYR